MDLSSWTRANVDPALAYLLFATALLTVVAVATGLVRRDHLALRRRSAALKLLAAIGVAVLVAHLTASVDVSGATDAPVWTQLGALFRVPLWLVTLAYGPTAGIAAALGYLGASALGVAPGSASPVLVVELAVLGWLAIFPSPLVHRWAGPLDALAAYLLAWGTAGVLQVRAAEGTVTWALVAHQHDGMLPGVLVAAVALLVVGPRTYRSWFAESRLQDAFEAAENAEG